MIKEPEQPADAGSGPLRIVLVEDHLILREGLQALLESDPSLQVVGLAGSVAEGLEVVASTAPSLVILDLSLPDRSGIELISALQASQPALAVLVLTAHKGSEFVRLALQAGAAGYVLKDSCHAELQQAIRELRAGRRYLCESVASTILGDYAKQPVAEARRSFDTLITEREREILVRVARGQSNKHAARELRLSVKTVEKHRSNVMRKLNLHNAAALTMFAIRYGLVDQEEAPQS